MKPEITKWINALRSDIYEQTVGTLCNSEGFCCLGVYAVVNNIATPGFMYDEEDEGPRSVYDTIRSTIPDDLINAWIGMNDDGKSFAEIADSIEESFRDADVQ